MRESCPVRNGLPPMQRQCAIRGLACAAASHEPVSIGTVPHISAPSKGLDLRPQCRYRLSNTGNLGHPETWGRGNYVGGGGGEQTLTFFYIDLVRDATWRFPSNFKEMSDPQAKEERITAHGLCNLSTSGDAFTAN
jgi:hypothetical protein